jgi:hypothetical protein
MADFNPNIVRAVAIEVQDSTLELYLALLPLLTTVRTWTLHCANAGLPDPFAVKLAVAQYQALKTQIRTLELRTWIETINAAEPDDGLEYMTPCEGVASGYFDGTATFDGSTTFNGEG